VVEVVEAPGLVGVVVVGTVVCVVGVLCVARCLLKLNATPTAKIITTTKMTVKILVDKPLFLPFCRTADIQWLPI
jgi:hypothetical protein